MSEASSLSSLDYDDGVRRLANIEYASRAAELGVPKKSKNAAIQDYDESDNNEFVEEDEEGEEEEFNGGEMLSPAEREYFESLSKKGGADLASSPVKGGHSPAPLLKQLSKQKSKRLQAQTRRRSSVAAVVEATKKSGIRKLLTDNIADNDADPDEFDHGVNSMALLCGLTLALPYQVIGNLGRDYFDSLRDQFANCPDAVSNGLTFDEARRYYKLCMNVSIYAAVAGMVLSTFYFLFKRRSIEDFLKWRRKARLLVILLFIATCCAMSGVMYLSSLLMRWYALNSDGIDCSSSSSEEFIAVVTFGTLLLCLNFYLIF